MAASTRNRRPAHHSRDRVDSSGARCHINTPTTGTIKNDSGRNWTAYAAATAAPTSDAVLLDRTKHAAARSLATHASEAEGSTDAVADHTSCSGVSARRSAAKNAATRSANRMTT